MNYLIYIGKGKGTLMGVPARDLTFEEASQFNIDLLIKSGLYKLAIDYVKKYDFEPKRKTRRSNKESE